ncbi:MAG: type II secretion system protein GspL [Algicola sp.]|nr:type II secretion system protein GspL [Algicola sp.]
MSEVLLIRLGSHAGDVIPWMVWSQTEQEIIGSGEIEHAGELDKLTEHGQSREVRVLVPACDVTLKTVPLPGKFNRQLQTALPFMLEDDLTQDVDQLFFAVGDKTTVGDKPAIEVAIVARQLMADWLSWLNAAQLHAVAIIPDALCLPLSDQGTTGIELNNQWLVRSGNWSCDNIDSIWFDDYLKLSANLSGAEQDEESDEVFSFVTHSPCLVEADNLNIVEASAELPLKLLANSLNTTGFNLLQGEFIVKKESSAQWQTWKYAAVICGLAILMQLAYRGTVAWQLSSELETQKAAFIQQFKKAYPGDRTRVQFIEKQIKQRLKDATGSAGDNAGFLSILADVGPLLSQSQGFMPTSFRYDAKRHELRLQATGDGFQSFEKFKSAAQKLGFVVQQGSLNNDGDKVAGAVTIKRAG